jgi:hypothetical protein
MLVLMVALLAVPHTLHAAAIVFRIFNLGETKAYVVQRNASTLDLEATSPSGVFDESIEAKAGDRIVLSLNEDLAPPAPPEPRSATANGAGCARLSWTPSGDATVVGYVVSYGSFSVEREQTADYQYSLDAGAVSSFDLCGLAGSTYYFSIQAINYAGQVSAYSQELTLEMTTTPVMISRFEVHARRDRVELTWETAADEVISGYRIYRRDEGAAEHLLVQTPLPADADAYVDATVRSATTYTYTLAAITGDGSEVRSAPVTATTPSFALALNPNSPNPFMHATRIPFTLDATAPVSIKVYDVRGALVTTLFNGTLPAGRHEVGWGGHNLSGNPVAAGAYFYTLTAGKHVESRKMVLVR